MVVMVVTDTVDTEASALLMPGTVVDTDMADTDMVVMEDTDTTLENGLLMLNQKLLLKQNPKQLLMPKPNHGMD